MSFEATTKYLSDPKWPIEETTRFEHALSFSEPSQFNQKAYLDLFGSAKSIAVKDAIILARLLDFYLISGPQIPSEYFDFGPNPSVGDPFYPITVLSFYTRWVQKCKTNPDQYLWGLVEPYVKQWVQKFNISDEGDGDRDLYISELVNLIASVSYTQPEYATQLAVHNNWFLVQFLDPSAYDHHVQFLSKFNPSAIPETGIPLLTELSLFTKRYFSITLNMILSQRTFESITEEVLSQKLSRLSYDLLYQFLHQCSRFEYSANFMLQLLPSMVSDYLVNLPSAISDQEIWNLKKSTLHNLLLLSDLGMWEDKVTSTYATMVNGKNVRDIIPTVDVTDEAA